MNPALRSEYQLLVASAAALIKAQAEIARLLGDAPPNEAAVARLLCNCGYTSAEITGCLTDAMVEAGLVEVNPVDTFEPIGTAANRVLAKAVPKQEAAE